MLDINIKFEIKDLLKNNNKLSKKDKEIIQYRIEKNIDSHKSKIDNLMVSILEDCKSEILKSNPDKDISFLDNLKEGNTTDKIDSLYENNLKETYRYTLLKTFLWNKEADKILDGIKSNINKFIETYYTQYYNFYNNKEIDINLLKKEKENLLKILKRDLPNIQNIIFNNFKNFYTNEIFKSQKAIMNLVDSNNNNLEKAFENLNIFYEQIENGYLEKYINNFADILGQILDSMIYDIEK